MSFNLNTKINNLQFQVNSILAGSVSNPLSTNLNANNKQINNVNTLSSVSGSPLSITAGASTINCASAVNMVDTLTINNNTIHNGLVVKDSAGDTSCFVVDQSGNVGVKVDPAGTLTSDFTVNGNASILGGLTISGAVTGTGIVSNVSAGAGLTKTGTSSNPTLSITPVGTAGTYAYPSSVVTNDKGQISSITAGTAPVASVTAGTGIGITGTSTAPVINNSGLLGLTSSNAGTNITISGTPTAPIISSSGLAGTNTTNPVVWLTGNSVTSSLGVGVPVPGTTVSVNAGEYWLVSIVASVISTVNSSSDSMGFYMQFNGGGQIWTLFEAVESTTASYQATTSILKIPAGKTSMTLYCAGGLYGSAGNINGNVESLIYSKMNFA